MVGVVLFLVLVTVYGGRQMTNGLSASVNQLRKQHTGTGEENNWHDNSKEHMDFVPYVPTEDSRTLSMKDVNFPIRDAVQDAKAPPKWAAGGVHFMTDDEMQPWDIGITDVFVTEPGNPLWKK